ncbi:MAG: hypothetical protein KDM91_00590 [Verrucomicrobiae bacterium]|nr:hypothetical protein [Verrucomicrobiae bacterium]
MAVAGILSGGFRGAPAQQVETSEARNATAPAAAEGGLPSDESILQRMPDMATEYLREVYGIYARLGNEKMTEAIANELRRRDPDFTASSADEGESGPENPHDALEDRIDAMMQARKYSEAIAFMEKLRTERFGGGVFPFEVELADAYGTVGDLERATSGYQRVIDGAGHSAEAKAAARAGIVEIEKLRATKIAYDLIERHRAGEALAQAEALRAKYPEDVEIELLHSQALVSNNRHAEALPTLEAIKARDYRGQSYPAQDALAESLLATGRLAEARAAYDELAVDVNALPHVRESAVRSSAEIFKSRTGAVKVDYERLSESEGDGNFIALEALAPVMIDTLAGVRAWYDDVSLSKERTLRASSGEFAGGVGFVRRYFGDGLTYFEGRAGGGQHGEVTWGASLGRERVHPGVTGYELSVDGNAPATDSLQLIALNGTEDRARVAVSGPLPGRFEYAADAWVRRVSADGADLGDGYGGFLEIGRPIWENRLETASLRLAYRADYERFNASRLSDAEAGRFDLLDDDGRFLGADLVEPRYHPHGLRLSWDSQVNPWLYLYAEGGLFYDFADEEWDYQFSAGMEVALTERCDLVAEAGYYSDGTGASNDESEVIVGTVGLRWYY